MERAQLASLLRLVVITDEERAASRGGVEKVVEAALEGGARCVQLRMKGAGARAMLEAAGPLRAMTREWGSLLVINDRVDVALAAEADGVHLGPDDLPVAPVRRAVGDDLLIGYSTDEPEAARRAIAGGADYIGCGAVFATSTKPDAGEVVGVEGLEAVATAVEAPVVGIGGITPEKALAVARTRAAGAAVVSAVMGAPDPERAVRRLLAPFQDRGGNPI